MARSEIVVGLDVGTTKVSALVGELLGDELEFLGYGVAACNGLRKGRVVDLSATTRAIRAAVARASRAASVEIAAVSVSVSGDHLRGQNCRGAVVVDGVVTEEHLRAVRQDARQQGLAPDRVVLHHRTRHYWMDGQPGIRQPLGMSAKRLEVDTHLITASAPLVENLVRCVHRAQLDVQELVASGLAAAFATLTKLDWMEGVLLADIGGGTTDLLICSEGSVCHTAVLPVGGDHVTNDLSIGLRISRPDAEVLKLRHAAARVADVGPGEYVAIRAVGDPEPREIPRRIVAEIVEPRLRELFQLVRAELEAASAEGVPPAKSVVLTGGGALLEGTLSLAREALGLPVRLGVPPALPGAWTPALEQPYHSVGIGLLRQAQLRRIGPDVNLHANGASPIVAAWSHATRWLREKIGW